MAKPAIFTIKKLVAMDPDMAKAIEDFRFDARFGSESEAIRYLIELGLETSARKQAGEGAQPQLRLVTPPKASMQGMNLGRTSEVQQARNKPPPGPVKPQFSPEAQEKVKNQPKPKTRPRKR